MEVERPGREGVEGLHTYYHEQTTLKHIHTSNVVWLSFTYRIDDDEIPLVTYFKLIEDRDSTDTRNRLNKHQEPVDKKDNLGCKYL